MATHCFSKKQLPDCFTCFLDIRGKDRNIDIPVDNNAWWDFTLSSLLEWIIKTGKSEKMRRLFEFIWQGFSSLGSSSQIYIGIFPKHYGLPNGFRIEINDVCDPIKTPSWCVDENDGGDKMMMMGWSAGDVGLEIGGSGWGRQRRGK
ncbi:hypothetical protein Tco_0718247 [Tanacetum coccineum]